MYPAGVEQNALGEGGLPAVDVGADANVAQLGQLHALLRGHSLALRYVPPLQLLRLQLRRQRGEAPAAGGRSGRRRRLEVDQPQAACRGAMHSVDDERMQGQGGKDAAVST